MRKNGGGRSTGRANDGTDRTQDAPRAAGARGNPPDTVREPDVVWTLTDLPYEKTREAHQRAPYGQLAYLEEKRAPDIVIRMLEAASDAACDELAWQAEVRAQDFRHQEGTP